VFIQRVTKVVIEAARYTTRKSGEAGPRVNEQGHPHKKRDRNFESHARVKSKKGDKDSGKDKQGRAWTLKCLNERCNGTHRVRECR
jgi:hypothetical protein